MENPPSNTPKGPGPNLNHLGELVILGFENLSYKHDPQMTPTRERPWRRIVVIEQDTSRESVCDRLQSKLLPLLKDHLRTVFELLEAICTEEEEESAISMKEKQASNLRRLLEMQPELDHVLTLIDTEFHVLCPEPASASVQTDDQQLKQFKTYRLFDFKKHFLCTLDSICRFFLAVCNYTARMAYHSWGATYDDSWFERKQDVLSQIEHTIKESKRSEMDVIEECGASGVRESEDLLDSLKGLVNPNGSVTNPFVDFNPLTHQPLIQLANLLIPLTKLLKMFFERISKRGMSYQRLPLYTEMNGDQFKCLSESNLIVGNVHTLIGNLTLYRETPPYTTAFIRRFTQGANQIASGLEAPSLYVVRYLVPLLDSLADQNHYQAWFDAWKIQFKAAIHNFIQAANQL
ncbi:hypothetical protein PTTG_29069 [Puccinia triticina 1-1 BBBD Race 1]|uniref:Uncharacterized protein n=1 Tax=Puccinia triticina (isolate 1-1 / race 1 (BBBD)) TaxID=630390 RepID=A0A180G6S7_PUCT1|nr:hypothetical protein PTTG_29069 [Puccinia triticina 1-1 BBBD Race 1]